MVNLLNLLHLVEIYMAQGKKKLKMLYNIEI